MSTTSINFSRFKRQHVINGLERSLAERSLTDYIRLAWPLLEPDTPYLHNWHIDAIAEYLTACTNGDIRRLIINIPPRYMKSFCVSVFWPTWVWGPLNRPGERWLFASYGSGQGQNPSTRDSLRRRNLMSSSWYQRHWGERVSFLRDQNEKNYYENTRHGSMFATTMSGGGLGFGGNFIVVDDPHKTSEVNSRAERDSVIDFYDQTLSRRLDDKRRGVIVLVMQRLGVNDLTGHLLEQKDLRGQPIWTHLKLPAEASDREVITFPISKREHVREKGELLWPEREGKAEIEMARLDLGLHGYAGQYDQEPVPVGGSVFNENWWQYYKDTPRSFSRVVISVDTAQKQNERSDYSAITVWGIDAENMKYYLVHVWRGRVEFPRLKRIVAAHVIKYRVGLSAVLIEDTSNGTPLIQELKQKVVIDNELKSLLVEMGIADAYHLGREFVVPPVLAIKVSKDKLARAEAVTPMIERGDVLLPDPDEYEVPWLPEFLLECTRFTGSDSAHDDQVDSLTQFLNYVRGLGSFNVIDHYRKLAMAISRPKPWCYACDQAILVNEPYTQQLDTTTHVKCPKRGLA